MLEVEGDWCTDGLGCLCQDDLSVRKILRTIAPAIPRHYLVMEVKVQLFGNLIDVPPSLPT
eukprot:4083822-Amphidinium_carterae.2